MQVIEFTLAERDNYLIQIEEQIRAKRKLLLDKRRVLKKTVKENRFLQNVKKDYDAYHQYIVKQKQDQIQSMNLLHHYIDDIMVSGKMTEKDIEQSRKEKQSILKEIDTIKHTLDKIIQEE